ncbi:zinc finger protein RTS2 [Aureobasidium pullulans]|uniref:Zinc finger protein RTS2 n=1 Tax=Aureobasidium pullulans TaxID=5580 RepID=A0A4S9NJ89_AURPU|nr:zinc finger protein RTS2 [Aureobasidium pullulans]THW25585.1 zinc finger protein RTS2 [Aureobasidium pullulans]THW49795.1 zinc finger protein RTS2 [Aureobasidium pullulans]THW70136.1 zinc finger protein RTS2 [Aureobasidium pullulans]THX25021.1 zinc finger protein RTS2 [Aureobasidium pullulans]
MPKAEVGSTKWLSNNMKSKGLQRLRWYCQVCQRQMRDENGFKQHTLSEGHVRAMLLVGEDPKKYIAQYSETFKKDFLTLLRTSHGEKKVYANHFYQEYIHDKEHIHMNSTKWPSLTEFVKYLGREGICRVEEGDRGLEIAWVDDSPEALRRREMVRKKEAMEKGDEERETRMLEAQIKRAQEKKRQQEEEDRLNHKTQDEETKPKKAQEGPLSFSLGLGSKPATTDSTETATEKAPSPTEKAPESKAEPILEFKTGDEKPAESPAPPAAPKLSLDLGSKPKRVNVFAAASKSKSNPLKEKKPAQVIEEPKKMSAAERIMREEMDRKRMRDDRQSGGGKRPRLGL